MDAGAFHRALTAEFEDARYARACLRAYFATTGGRYTGSQFEALCDPTNENIISGRDLYAVHALSVEIPVFVARWILADAGSAKVSSILERIDPSIDLWETDHPEHGRSIDAMGELWQLLNRINWPEQEVSKDPVPNKMGWATISKLIATKRPRFCPVLDSVIRDRFFPDCSTPREEWSAFIRALSDEDLRTRIDTVTNVDGLGSRTSLLRRIDAVLWMRNRSTVKQMGFVQKPAVDDVPVVNGGGPVIFVEGNYTKMREFRRTEVRRATKNREKITFVYVGERGSLAELGVPIVDEAAD